jgi:hypothetical protein
MTANAIALGMKLIDRRSAVFVVLLVAFIPVRQYENTARP